MTSSHGIDLRDIHEEAGSVAQCGNLEREELADNLLILRILACRVRNQAKPSARQTEPECHLGKASRSAGLPADSKGPGIPSL